MKHIFTQSFDIAYPDVFTNELISFGDVVLSNPDEDFVLQQPQIIIALDKITTIREIDDLIIKDDANTEDLLQAYYQLKRYNIIEFENDQVELNGKTCFTQTAISSVKHEDKDIRIYHLFATIVIDEFYVLDITADCEMAVKDIYEPLFWQLISDLKCKGNHQKHYEIHEIELQKRLDEIDKILEENKPSVINFEKSDEEIQSSDSKVINIPAFALPKDGKECFVVGDYSLDLDDADKEFSISDFSKTLSVKVHFKTLDEETLKQGVEDELFDTYADPLGFDFELKQVFDNYQLNASYQFEDGKTNAPLFLHMYLRGFEYSLSFYGRVELKKGWLGIDGFLKPSYADTPQFKFKVYCKIDAEKLDWENYQFSYAEALKAKPNDVRYLNINKPDFITLPDELFTFKQLKTLTILGNYNYIDPQNSYSPLNKISEKVSKLSHLESLHISNTCITDLTESIGALTKLHSVYLQNNKLETLPESLFTLSHLKYLNADSNYLKYLPEQVNLPKLEYLSLERNQLLTLPVQLVTQAKLRRVSIAKNSFNRLPVELNAIAEINLDLSEKQRLLDFDYKGADGKGETSWENSVYFTKNDQQLISLLANAINGTVLEKHYEALKNIALKAVCLETTRADDYSQCGNTRFGGLPDLPVGIAYPEFESSYHEKRCGWQFIAQLNCAELADFQDYLPRTGIIYFFLEDQESFNCKLIYSNGDALKSAKELTIDEDYIGDDGGIYAPFIATATSMIALPSFYNGDPAFDGTSLEDFEDSKEFDEYTKVSDELVQKLGVKGIYQEWNDCFYPDRHHAINTYVFTQHESPQEQAALVKKGKLEDWVILLKVHSDNNCGFCFWDAGEISFVIHKSDLAKQDFSNVICTLETS